jgi:CheY-like chemotaxis protein
MGGEVAFTSEVGRGSLFSFVVQVAVAESAKPRVDLSALRIAVVAAPGALRSELVGLAQGWRAQFLEVDEVAALQGREWDTAIIDVDEKLARALTAPGASSLALPVARAIGLVPIALPSELRSVLRTHFRLLVNKPVHHEALYALLGGLAPDAEVAPQKPIRFDLRVLLVEDNAVNQRLMQKVLTNFGCQFTIANNGRRAVDELIGAEDNYDVVLMDLHMPEMDGMTAIKEIREGRAGAKNKNLWIITLTADAREAQREHALAAGANDYLVKPLQLRDLEVAFRRFGEAQAAAK